MNAGFNVDRLEIKMTFDPHDRALFQEFTPLCGRKALTCLQSVINTSCYVTTQPIMERHNNTWSLWLGSANQKLECHEFFLRLLQYVGCPEVFLKPL